MEIRKFNNSEIKKLLELCKIALDRDNFTEALIIDNVINDMGNPEMCLVALENSQLVGFGMGVIRKRENETMGYIKLICVHPNYRRKGIAQKLYDEIESKMRENQIKIMRLIESWANYYMPGIDPFYTEAIAFFERNGYNKIGDASNLLCDLSQNLDTTAEEEKANRLGVVIKRATANDNTRLMDWAEVNFKGWQEEMNRALNNNPISLHYAESNGEIIAFAAYETNNPGMGWFGPVGTSEAARGKGVGGILLKKCLQDLKNASYTEAIIPWVAHIPFYMHYINSKVNRVFWRYEKILENVESK
jgi:ribosomal protein S18 acetylase RimI-like enzyme